MSPVRCRRVGRSGNPVELLNLTQCFVPWGNSQVPAELSGCPILTEMGQFGSARYNDRIYVSGSPPGTTTADTVVLR